MAKKNKEKKLSKKEKRELAEEQMNIDRIEFRNSIKNSDNSEDEIIIPVPPKYLAEEVFKIILGVLLFLLFLVFFGLLAWYFIIQSDSQMISGLPVQTTQTTQTTDITLQTILFNITK